MKSSFQPKHTPPTEDQYRTAFENEQRVEYPVIDGIERTNGFKMARPMLERMAAILACPVKVNPPNWQHGRVIFSLWARYLSDADGNEFSCADVGTAKGFSALCASAALRATGKSGMVYSCDVIDPAASTYRNSIADPATIAELITPWPELGRRCVFFKMTGAEMLVPMTRVHLAFLDGKHSYEAVAAELALLTERQQPGDLTIADDLQVEGVRRAITARVVAEAYEVNFVEVLPNRRHAILRRK